MYAGDETTSWNDAGPCPQCGDRDCWNGCPPETEPVSYDEAEAAGVDGTLRFIDDEAQPVAMFEVGASYSTRSACDSNCRWTFTVTARTAKFITIAGNDTTRRVGVYVLEGTESALPMGNYSMAPVISADTPDRDEVAS